MHHKNVLAISTTVLIVGVGLVAWYFLGADNSSQNKQKDIDKQQVAATALACVEKLPRDIRIGQKIMMAAYGDQLAAETPLLVSSNLGGIIVMDSPDKATIHDYVSSAVIAPIIAVDQEGGTVQRYKAEGDLPGAEEMAAHFTPEQAYAQYIEDARYLKTMGITTNFAPVVDVASAEPTPLPGRMYSADPSAVVTYARQAIMASKAAGITPVMKHFPGLGSASGNTDYGAATTDSFDILKMRDLIPYQQLSNLSPDVMVTNAIVPGLTDGQPAIWSPRVIALLRDEGYQNAVVYSDSLTAEAVPGNLGDAVVKAWRAGVDIALIVQTNQQTPALQQYLQGIITRATAALTAGEVKEDSINKSVLRILNRKGIDPCTLSQE